MWLLLLLAVAAVSALPSAPPAGWQAFLDPGAGEVSSEVGLRVVQGSVPRWANGVLLRNAPGGYTTRQRNATHVFDGFAKLVRFRVQDGNVTVLSKFIRTNYYNGTLERQSLAPLLLVTRPDPDWTEVERLEAAFGENHVNPLVCTIPGEDSEWLATSDAATMYSFDEDLNTVGEFAYTDPITWRDAPIAPAHALRWHNGSLVNWLSGMNKMKIVTGIGKHKLHLTHMAAGSTYRDVIVTHKVDRVPYIHAFALSDNYSIALNSPMRFDLSRIFFTPYVTDMLKWFDVNTELMVVNMNTGKLSLIQLQDQSFCTHVANAWEENDEVVFDCVVFLGEQNATFMFHAFSLDNMAKGIPAFPGLMRRFRINTTSMTAAYTELFPNLHVDLPRINENWVRRPNCYIYTWNLTNLFKMDTCKGRVLELGEPAQLYGEPLFVPRPGGVTEDDGLVMTNVYDGLTESMYLVVIDAKTFKVVAKTSAVPQGARLGFSIHGAWKARGQ